MLSAAFGPSAPAAQRLTFEKRVEAQRAIERVAYEHQIGVTEPFDAVVTRQTLERQVRTYLEQSAALGQVWGTPITAQMLRDELGRIARATWFPERLRELYGALGNDPFVVAECLARQTLVGRLARHHFAYDRVIHAAAREEAERARQAATRDASHIAANDVRWVIEELLQDDRSHMTRFDPRGPVGPAQVSDALARRRALYPDRVGTVGPLIEEREAFVFRIVLAEDAHGARVATHVVPKLSWERWRETLGVELDTARVTAAGAGREPLPLASTRSEVFARGTRGDTIARCRPPQGWEDTSLNVPEPRAWHTAVWTGSRMIVWGGSGAGNTGSVYDPVMDLWRPTSLVGAPTQRFGHTAVWTGSRMLIWGGGSSPDIGGIYDPATDTWTAMTGVGAPPSRLWHTAVWTGTRMIVWGGSNYPYGGIATGGVYDPVGDTWSPTSTIGTPSGRLGHTAVWTGQRMIVFGGDIDEHSGALYDPATNTWSPIPSAGAPSPRAGHTAVWTGTRMFVWGGVGGGPLNTGAAYDPVTSSWTPMSTDSAPPPRSAHTAIWTGSHMVVWAGQDGDRLDSGGAYEVATDTWSPMSAVGTPSARVFHTAVWTGSRMIVWGGDGTDAETTGGAYDPITDGWTPVSDSDAPQARYFHTAVWTGSRMIVWGGSFPYLASGGVYDPTTDSWTPTSSLGAPTARDQHSAVWTGSRMIVWGGETAFNAFADSGGAYDPASDTWSTISTVGAPAPRVAHSAVWTGNVLVVWGGLIHTSPTHITTTDTGAAYDPVHDTWTPTTQTDAPWQRFGHGAVWTGTRMLVWGGYGPNDGSSYDPTTNTWTPITTVGAPERAYDQTTIWTGTHMVVWGGTDDDFNVTNHGGLYDAVHDIWTLTSNTDAPAGRVYHSAIWTGSTMVVWGGLIDVSGEPALTGGIYDPVTDRWAATSTARQPSPRTFHTAIWTGARMLVWGGAGLVDGLGNGGAYRPLWRVRDGDVLCSGSGRP